MVYKLIRPRSHAIKHRGAKAACRAHNSEVTGSNPVGAPFLDPLRALPGPPSVHHVRYAIYNAPTTRIEWAHEMMVG